MIAGPSIAGLPPEAVDEITAVVQRHLDHGREVREIVSTLRDLYFRVDQLQVAMGTDLLWSLETTCQKLGGVSDDFVRQLADAGEIQRVYQGRRPFFIAASVRAYVERLSDAP